MGFEVASSNRRLNGGVLDGVLRGCGLEFRGGRIGVGLMGIRLLLKKSSFSIATFCGEQSVVVSL